LTHIFEVSRFEVLISRLFWACFSKPPDLHMMGVARSEEGLTMNIASLKKSANQSHPKLYSYVDLKEMVPIETNQLLVL